MNEKVKCNRFKGSEFKKNKRKTLLCKNLQNNCSRWLYDYPRSNKSPWSSLCGFSWNRAKNAEIIAITLLSLRFNLISYKMISAIIT